MTESFWKEGNRATLLIALIYLEISFVAWNLLGPLAVFIKPALGFTGTQISSIVSTAILAGAILRLPAGGASDAFGPRNTGIFCQIILIAGLAAAWILQPASYPAMLALALLLGIGGASFAVAIPLASGWYSGKFQGTALGIVGIGNSGVALSALFAPALAPRLNGVFGHSGWLNVAGLMAIPLILTLIGYLCLAEDGPNRKSAAGFGAWMSVLGRIDSWLLMFFYAVTFGGFVGLAFFLTIYFNAEYGLNPAFAGLCAGLVSIAGSLIRPFGGALADKIGGIPSLIILFTVAAATFALIAFGLPLALAFSAFLVGMLTLGLGNGAVFELVPLRFPKEVGVATGLVGMAGGVGGAILTQTLGMVKQFSGAYGSGFLGFSGMCVLTLAGSLYCARLWRVTPPAKGRP